VERLPAAARREIEGLVQIFLAEKRFEGAWCSPGTTCGATRATWTTATTWSRHLAWARVLGHVRRLANRIAAPQLPPLG
jgi:hypothetical protein